MSIGSWFRLFIIKLYSQIDIFKYLTFLTQLHGWKIKPPSYMVSKTVPVILRRANKEYWMQKQTMMSQKLSNLVLLVGGTSREWRYG